jgi:hypothetical protein
MGEPIEQATKPQSKWFRKKNTTKSKKRGKGGPSTTT